MTLSEYVRAWPHERWTTVTYADASGRKCALGICGVALGLWEKDATLDDLRKPFHYAEPFQHYAAAARERLRTAMGITEIEFSAIGNINDMHGKDAAADELARLEGRGRCQPLP